MLHSAGMFQGQPRSDIPVIADYFSIELSRLAGVLKELESGLLPQLLLLYLLGTMNTADRSIALLDTALRRRFDFEEMMPRPEFLGEVGDVKVNLQEMLEALNRRVEFLYDRDHTIGHAFFMGVKSLVDLEAVFRRKVIPLLQEYFYEDWQKIGQALNDSGDGSRFLKAEELTPPGLLGQDKGYGEARKRYTINATFPANAFRGVYPEEKRDASH